MQLISAQSNLARVALLSVILCLQGCGEASTQPSTTKLHLDREAQHKNIRLNFSPQLGEREPRQIRASDPRLINTHIAGIPHRLGNRVDISAIFSEGQSLQFSREPNNPHDPNAIRLFIASKFIGYIAKKDNKLIARHLDSGGFAVVQVCAVDHSDVWQGVKIRVLLK